MSWKYFITEFGNDPLNNIGQLRKKYPNHSYMRGIHKDVKGIYVIKDTKEKDYGEKYELDDGSFFWNPSAENTKKILDDLPSYKTEPEERIQVKLAIGGRILDIYPASVIPRVAIFSKRKASVSQSDDIYTRSDEYGAKAYELYDLAKKSESMRLDDPLFVSFVEMALKRSYTLPVEVWDALGVITYSDYDNIFSAAMGIDPHAEKGEQLKKT